MKTFSDQLFPTDIAYGTSGGPEYATDIVITKSGKEQRNCNFQRPRYRYNVAHGVKNQQQLLQLISFFRNHKGQAIGFRFKDWVDYQAHNQNLKPITTKEYQLVKFYDTDERIITKPVINSVQLYQNKKKIESNRYQIDYKSGRVTFDQEVSGSLTADFHFDVPVRFAHDKLSASMDNYNAYSWADISLVEIL
jgi:uncharacterized protein (TIGR02217 family)